MGAGAHTQMSRFVEAVTLTGLRWVRLEPLTAGHVDEIASAASDGDPGALWFTMAPSPETAGDWIDRMLALQAAGGLTFLVRRLDGTPIGSSSYLNVDGPNRRLEIGATWYSASARRTGVNSETKLLMLGHAFDTLGCVPSSSARTSSTSPAAPPSNDSAPSSTACCAAISFCPTGRGATQWCTQSSTSNGLRCETISRRAAPHRRNRIPGRDFRRFTALASLSPEEKTGGVRAIGGDRRVLVVAILASFVAFLDGSVVNLALPAMARDLHGGLALQQWIVDSYLLTLGALILVAGSISDVFGRVPVLRWGLIAFGVGSALAAAAPSGLVLVIARLIQGAGAAFLVPSSLALINSTFTQDDQPRAVGVWTAWT
ncbi:MAG TPA: MFS transporter, partial [Mycobacterium sp.]